MDLLRALLPAPELERLYSEATDAAYSDPELLRRLANDAIAAARRRGDVAGELRGRLYLASAQQTLGDIEAAIEELNEMLLLAEASDDDDARFAALRALGSICDQAGCFESALDYLQQAESSLDAESDEAKCRDLRRGIATVFSHTGRLEEAVERHLALARDSAACGNLKDQAVDLCNAGTDLARLGRYQEALDILDEAEALVRRFRWPLMLATVHAARAIPLRVLGREEEVEYELLSALPVFTGAGHVSGQIDVRIRLAELYLDRHDLSTARLLLQGAVEIAAASGRTPQRVEALDVLIRVCKAAGEFATALDHSETLRELTHQMHEDEASDQAWRQHAEVELAAARKDVERVRRQRDRWQKAHAEQAQLNDMLRAAHSVQRNLIAALSASYLEQMADARRRGERELARASRYQRPLTAAWLGVAQPELAPGWLAGQLREEDVAVPLEGGLLLLLPETDRAMADAVCARIAHAHLLSFPGSEPLDIEVIEHVGGETLDQLAVRLRHTVKAGPR
ncbi:hypothetical protein [Chitinimonas lacunae]|uniref:Tetratricopeptide repeat protein n=1 Tax=Chitinimonas lacunae TaxID=1963018 RepID=A0ABV8MMQ8_9NEIS